MPKRFKNDFLFFSNILKKGTYKLPPGITMQKISAIEKELKISFPADYRKFILLTDGAELFNGKVKFYRVADLLKQNKKIWGGWFNEKHIFFAEAYGKPNDPDWVYEYLYFFDYDKISVKGPEVRYFNCHPTDVGKSSSNFISWLKLLVIQKGYGIPKNHKRMSEKTLSERMKEIDNKNGA